MTRRGVIFDLVGAQSPSYRGRGIARYSIELARAMATWHPDLVSAIALHPELPVPEGLDDLATWTTTDPDWSAAGVLHISSVFEPEVPVRTYWPREASANGLLTTATVYDLIPDLFPGWYLVDPGLRRRWRCCREVVRAADAVFTLSESARKDTISLLGIPDHRVTTIGSGIEAAFRPPASRSEALSVARKRVRGLRKGFLLYAGAFNPRKNVDRLIEGYASMPVALVDQHQLVIVCEAPRLTRNHYLVMAKELGLQGRVLIPGWVPDDIFVALHQAADLAVYPSLYEGYGLPVVDALACGTPAIGGDNSSLQELLPREARFQPDDAWAIGEAITRALTDEQLRARLRELTKQEPPAWRDVADRAASVFEQLIGRATSRPTRWRRRPHVAAFGAPAGLINALAKVYELDVFEGPFDAGADVLPGDGSAPGAVPAAFPADRPLAWAALARLDRWRGGYDAVVGWVAHSNEQEMRGLEQLGADWPGRAVAVINPTAGEGGTAALSKLEAWGVRALFGEADAFEEAARQVVGAGQATST